MICNACSSPQIQEICAIDDVPVHSVMLAKSRQGAIDFPRGQIRLGFCETCGFIFNMAYDPALQNYYSDLYESTQAYSPTFNEFQRSLAKSLIEQFGLHGRSIIEIGCGQGEFLSLLCELGDNSGIGFDPAYIEGNSVSGDKANITFIKDYYSEKYADYQADFICCKMTLEHIQNPQEFVGMVRRSIGEQLDTVVFFQVPDVIRILDSIAFWDVYYEHCSYFSPESFTSLFRNSDFEVAAVKVGYDDQYLMLDATPIQVSAGNDQEDDIELDDIRKKAKFFRDNFQARLDTWRMKIKELLAGGSRIVIWGAGSKGVAFLTTLGVTDEIKYVVDINPRKHGTYLAGSGQEIVGPQFIREYQPDAVLVMNPIYLAEIGAMLEDFKVGADLIPVE